MTVFLDTSGLYAVFDRDDESHSRAKIAWASLRVLKTGTAPNFAISSVFGFCGSLREIGDSPSFSVGAE